MTHLHSIRTQDVRFPTSLELDGSDAVNVDPDYSAAYLELELSTGEVGHALVFTAGRGNEVMTAAINSAAELLRGHDMDDLIAHMGKASDTVIHDSQMRWLGPEKGVHQMAAGAVVNALWDIKAKRAGLPLWELVARMSPEEIVEAVDFRHIRNALTEDEALQMLRDGQVGKEERIQELKDTGYRAYTTSPGWLGYSDEKMLRLSQEAVDAGFGLIKLKVGASIEDDRRRMSLVRELLGPDFPVAIDANQIWEVDQAIDWVNQLAEYSPYWIEEPTSTDEILGHAAIRKGVAPVRVATGEAVHNRIIFKQMLQAGAIDVMQIDSTRVAGVNENLANMLLAAKFGVIVCPHAGGVGLCELVQHFPFIDYAVISRSREDRYIEYVDHLHEHFVDPVVMKDGYYMAPQKPGISAEMFEESRATWTYPTGAGWVALKDNK
jgi:L-fuconate dehydratase